MKTGFVGAGNMGGAILRGALQCGTIKKEDTAVFGVNLDKLRATGEELGVKTYTDISEIVADSEIVMLGVKPQKFPEVMPKVAEGLTKCGPDKAKTKLIVSMAAGITLAKIADFVGGDKKIIRIMPNTPVRVGAGMTSISRNSNVTDEELERVMDIFEGNGKICEVPEDMIHTVIGVSGSSPAYTYLYIDALINEAIAEGMEPEAARMFAAQAVIGAAKMVLESEEDPQILCKNVCSPGGTTIEAVNVLKNEGFEPLVAKAFKACTDKSKKMSE